MRNVLTRSPRVRNQTRIVEIEDFGRDIDLLWDRLRKDFPIAFARESKFLNWRFGECPQMRYRRYIAIREGTPVGYMVLRETKPVELPEGVIVDLIAARRDRATIEDLVAFAVEFFGNNVAAVACATSIPEFAEVLRGYGFHPVRTERPNCVVADLTLRQRFATSANDWLFSKADHDWDQIHLA